MDVLDSRLFLDLRRESKVLFIGDRMHALGGTGMEAYFSVWWIDGTTLGNENGFLCQPKGGRILG